MAWNALIPSLEGWPVNAVAVNVGGITNQKYCIPSDGLLAWMIHSFFKDIHPLLICLSADSLGATKCFLWSLKDDCLWANPIGFLPSRIIVFLALFNKSSLLDSVCLSKCNLGSELKWSKVLPGKGSRNWSPIGFCREEEGLNTCSRLWGELVLADAGESDDEGQDKKPNRGRETSKQMEWLSKERSDRKGRKQSHRVSLVSSSALVKWRERKPLPQSSDL